MPTRRRAPVLLAAWLLPVLCLAAPAAPDAAPGLPLPDGVRLLLTAQGEGVQIYVAQPRAGGGGFQWTLRGPQATLYDGAHRKIGTHFAGPTWAGLDGSRVVGDQPPLRHMDSPKPGSVPWLVLTAKSHAGAGVFRAVAFVLRVDTDGGAAPAQAPTRAGQVARVKYRATYVFLAPYAR